jgi:hypothetical protein
MPPARLANGILVYGKTAVNRGWRGLIIDSQPHNNRWKYLIRWEGHGDTTVFCNSFSLVPLLNQPPLLHDEYHDEIIQQQQPIPQANVQQVVLNNQPIAQLVIDLG